MLPMSKKGETSRRFKPAYCGITYKLAAGRVKPKVPFKKFPRPDGQY